MQVIAIVNEKGGTAKTTTAVNLAAALGRQGRRVLLVDLDGQAAASRWLGVEEDGRLAEALIAGGGLEPVADVVEGVDLAPACGRIDSVAHELRPTQGGQLRRVLGGLDGRYDHVLIDCPPSLGNRLIGNALLAATHALVPVETSILALDGLRILLTMLGDIREGFGHAIELMGILACRYDARTRLSRLVLAELRRTLPEHVFATVIRNNVRLQEAPAAQQTIFDYAPDSTAAEDYQSLAGEILTGRVARPGECPAVDSDAYAELNQADRQTLQDFRARAAAELERKNASRPPARAICPEQAPDLDETTANSPARSARPGSTADACDLAHHADERPDADGQDGRAAGQGQRTAAVETSAGPHLSAGPLAGADASASLQMMQKEHRRLHHLSSLAAGLGLLLVVGTGWIVTNQLNGPPRQASAGLTMNRQAGPMKLPTDALPLVGEPTALGRSVGPVETGRQSGWLVDDRHGQQAIPIADGASEQAGELMADAAVEPSLEPPTDTDLLPTTGLDWLSAQVEVPGSSAEPVRADTEHTTSPVAEATGGRQGDATTSSPSIGQGQADGRTEPVTVVAGQGAEDLTTWRLTATVVDGRGRGLAMLNGRLVRQGQIYRGYRVEQVGRNTVELSASGRRYRLAIGRPVEPVE